MCRRRVLSCGGCRGCGEARPRMQTGRSNSKRFCRVALIVMRERQNEQARLVSCACTTALRLPRIRRAVSRTQHATNLVWTWDGQDLSGLSELSELLMCFHLQCMLSWTRRWWMVLPSLLGLS
jgi:hypothetical protein